MTGCVHMLCHLLTAMDAQILFTNQDGGFDHHDSMKANLRPKMKYLNANLRKLVNQLKADQLWDDTVIGRFAARSVMSNEPQNVLPIQSHPSSPSLLLNL